MSLRYTVVASVLAALPVALETPAFGAVSLEWAGSNGAPAARGGYLVFSTRRPAEEDGMLEGPVELWAGAAGNPQRIIVAQAPAPSFPSLTITDIPDIVVDDDGALTFEATLSDGSVVLYTGVADELKVLAGRGPAIEGMTGLLTTQLQDVYPVSVNGLGISASDGSLWLHFAGKNTLLGTITDGSTAAPWSDGHAARWLLSQVTPDGAFAMQATYGAPDAPNSERKYGIAMGTSALDITMPIPFTAPDSNGFSPFAPARDAAGNVVFALAPSASDPISAVGLVKGGTRTELARVGEAAPGVAGKIMTQLSAPSMSSSGRIVFFGRSDQVACAAERSCGTVWTGSPDHIYPAAASGYELPGTGATILWLSLASGINEKGQFVVNAAVPRPNSSTLDVAFYLYDPSVGFTPLMSLGQSVPEVDPGLMSSLLTALPAGDDQFFLDILFDTPSVHNTWALATVSGLTPVGTDIALAPSTFVGTGTGGAGAGGAGAGGTGAGEAGAGGSRPSTGGTTAGGASAGASVNPSGGAAAGQASAGTSALMPGSAPEKSGGCALTTGSRQNPFIALGLLAAAGLLAMRGRRRTARR
jgi:hypothetical protein